MAPKRQKQHHNADGGAGPGPSSQAQAVSPLHSQTFLQAVMARGSWMKESEAKELLQEIMGSNALQGRVVDLPLRPASLRRSLHTLVCGADATYNALLASLNEQLAFSHLKLKSVRFPVRGSGSPVQGRDITILNW